MPEGPARHPAPIPALPPQLHPDTEGEVGGGTQFCMGLSTPSAGLRLTSLPLCPSSPSLEQQTNSVLCRGIDPSRTFYVLNPQNNLSSTEECFRSWFER